MTGTAAGSREAAGGTPFFTLVVPCCDVSAFVRECFDSVLAQKFTDWEIVAGVEESKDDTLEIVRGYAAKDPRIRFFTAGRSGSCSASRNTGTSLARGEYIIFLDGDDVIAPDSLARIADGIKKHPGADLYPCAINVADENLRFTGELRDNYPPDAPEAMTGSQATLLAATLSDYPCPMLQMTVFSRRFLVENKLECIYGLRNQDSEFSPRALYLARRVTPLHEPFYIYRIRKGSVQTVSKEPGRFLKDFAVIMRSLFAFHAKVSREEDFDRRVTACWAREWLSMLFGFWFFPTSVKNIPRKKRVEMLQRVFENGYADFNALLRVSSRVKRTAGWFVRLAAKHPRLAFATDFFFRRLYYPLVALRDKRSAHSGIARGGIK